MEEQTMHFLHEDGSHWTFCRARRQPDQETSEENHVHKADAVDEVGHRFMAMQSVDDCSLWFLDSGCTDHV